MTIHTLSPRRRSPMTVFSARTFVPYNRAMDDPMAAHTLLPRRRRPHDRVHQHRHSSSSDKGTEQNKTKKHEGKMLNKFMQESATEEAHKLSLSVSLCLPRLSSRVTCSWVVFLRFFSICKIGFIGVSK